MGCSTVFDIVSEAAAVNYAYLKTAISFSIYILIFSQIFTFQSFTSGEFTGKKGPKLSIS